MKRNLLTIVIGAVLVVIFGLLLFSFQVRQTEVAVVTRFGKPVRNIDKPDLYWKLPWPIEKHIKFDQRIQTFEDKFTEDQTADSVQLLTMVYVGWRISDAKLFFPKFTGGSVSAAERMLEGILRSAKSAVVGKHSLGDFVNADPRQLKFDSIEAEIKAQVQAQLAANNCGIAVEFLGMKKLGLPDSVTQAVFERMTSERAVLVSKSQFEGEAEAQKIRSAAEREAARITSEAESRAIRIRGEGEAKAAELLPVFELNPALANFDLRLKALEQSLKEKSTLIFDQRTPPFDLFQGFTTNRPSR
jgi:membrane protease subunit HflC